MRIKDLEQKVQRWIPGAEILIDCDGQLVIYTGLVEDSETEAIVKKDTGIIYGYRPEKQTSQSLRARRQSNESNNRS